jgi:cytidylate kinase
MAVVTISRKVGTGGTEIAKRVCDRLGYSFFDKVLMAQVAAEVGLAAYEVVDYSEETYKVKSFFERLFGRRTPVVPPREPAKPSAPGGEVLTVEQLNEARYVAFVRSTITAAYNRGNVVIVGRGGQAILQNMPGTFHVRIDAPEGARIRRLEERENWNFSKAYQYIVDRDQAATQFLSEFFSIKPDDPMLYHLIINTSRVELNTAADLIVTAVQQMPEHPAEGKK